MCGSRGVLQPALVLLLDAELARWLTTITRLWSVECVCSFSFEISVIWVEGLFIGSMFIRMLETWSDAKLIHRERPEATDPDAALDTAGAEQRGKCRGDTA